jgi:hypothetical protein
VVSFAKLDNTLADDKDAVRKVDAFIINYLVDSELKWLHLSRSRPLLRWLHILKETTLGAQNR